MGVCMHPIYGGWFAMRCAFIFKNVKLDESFQRRFVEDPLNGDEKKIIELLRNFNDNWRDWTYRDAVNPKEKYSLLQQEYFDSAPNTRKDLIRAWLGFDCLERLIYSRECQSSKKDYLEKNFYLV
jgi:methylmalonic aciduria homocystinuria type C protein